MTAENEGWRAKYPEFAEWLQGTPAPVDLTPELLARWEELAAKATPGPWREGDYLSRVIGGPPEYYEIAQVTSDDADTWFIAEARTTVPALLSGVRSRDARIVELEQRSAEAEAVIAEARERLGQVEESQWVSHLKVSIGVLSRAVVYDTLRILSGYRAGVDHG